MLLFTDERGTDVRVDPEDFVIAGYTGRDQAMVQKHIDELALEGIAPPPEVPMWYPMPTSLLTTSERIAVPSAQSCGEVEPVLIGVNGTLYLGIGSDHTARDVEREDIAKSKRVCPKPLGLSVINIAALDARLDALVLESSIDDEPYQRGTFAQLLPLDGLLASFRKRGPATTFVLFCGTVPLLTHGFRFGCSFRARIWGPAAPVALTLDYTVDFTS